MTLRSLIQATEAARVAEAILIEGGMEWPTILRQTFPRQSQILQFPFVVYSIDTNAQISPSNF